MFKNLTHEELWELYYVIRHAGEDTYKASVFPQYSSEHAATYRELDALRKELGTIINPIPVYPVLH
jgi:hypothetical protein